MIVNIQEFINTQNFFIISPEKTLGLGANIESALLSSDGNLVYVKLLGGSLDKNITKIKIIFTNADGDEFIYETSEGVQEIEVPFKRSFWQWLLGKQLKGIYDYEINSNEIGLENFETQYIILSILVVIVLIVTVVIVKIKKKKKKSKKGTGKR